MEAAGNAMLRKAFAEPPFLFAASLLSLNCITAARHAPNILVLLLNDESFTAVSSLRFAAEEEAFDEAVFIRCTMLLPRGATVFFTYLPAPQIKAAAYLTASFVQLQTSAPTFSAKVTGALSMGTSLFCFPLFIQHLLSLSFVRDVGYYNIKCVRFQLISFIFGLCAKM